jgi:hypothetical protein
MVTRPGPHASTSHEPPDCSQRVNRARSSEALVDSPGGPFTAAAWRR